jgi:ATP-dependent Clp protease ATP-binding subunit ClpB
MLRTVTKTTNMRMATTARAMASRPAALPRAAYSTAMLARRPTTATSPTSRGSTLSLTRSYANGNFPPGGFPPGGFPHRGYPQQPQQQGPQKGETLKQFTVDLTEQAEKGKLDPVIGRDEEVKRIM